MGSREKPSSCQMHRLVLIHRSIEIDKFKIEELVRNVPKSLAKQCYIYIVSM